jgi:hypothetical protein
MLQSAIRLLKRDLPGVVLQLVDDGKAAVVAAPDTISFLL